MKRLLLILLLLTTSAEAQIYPSCGPAATVSSLPSVKYFTVTLDGASNTLDVATASGDCYIKSVTAFVKVIPTTGAATSNLVTNENSPKTLLAATIHSGIQTAGTTLTAFTTPFLLADTKKIQRTNVGTGAGGGSFVVAVEFYQGPSCSIN